MHYIVAQRLCLFILMILSSLAFKVRSVGRRMPLLASVRRLTAITDKENKHLNEVRAKMNEFKVDALIIPTDDPHMSEYTAPCFGRREFISGFTGSAGTAVITRDVAALFTDGRYHSQAEQELDLADWTLMRVGMAGVPSLAEFLATTLPTGSAVGVDASVHSAESHRKLKAALGAKGVSVYDLRGVHPVDAVWGENRPPLPTGTVREHPLEYAGKSAAEKLNEVRGLMKQHGATALVVTMLDEVAWLFNLRGRDVECNPVALSYAVLTQETAHLFIDSQKVPDSVRQSLHSVGVQLHPYEAVTEFVKGLADYDSGESRGGVRGGKVWVDGRTVNQAIYSCIPDSQRLDRESPLVLLKACKNPAELKGMRTCHLRDAAAVVEFLTWLDAQFGTYESDGGAQATRINNSNRGCSDGISKAEGPGAASISEVALADKLESFRAHCAQYLEPSFATIAGVNENAAIIHYRAKAGQCKALTGQDMLLLDSGAQYADGTTDVTRTVHMGMPTPNQKEMFTRVLKGHIALDRQCFPPGTPGCLLDTLARQHLWQVGRNYLHGTGHGVGAALNVHEGPQRISSVLNAQPLLPGMIVSNEPGYYEPGNFGIRIENLLEVVQLPNGYLRFQRLTHIPIQIKLMDLSLLSREERKWVNGYHEEVWDRVEPLLWSEEARRWLRRSTLPLPL